VRRRNTSSYGYERRTKEQLALASSRGKHCFLQEELSTSRNVMVDLLDVKKNLANAWKMARCRQTWKRPRPREN